MAKHIKESALSAQGFDELTDEDIAIVRAYAKNNMRTSDTARDTNYSWYTINYHMDRVEKKTGFDPRVFYDLVDLLRWMR